MCKNSNTIKFPSRVDLALEIINTYDTCSNDFILELDRNNVLEIKEAVLDGSYELSPPRFVAVKKGFDRYVEVVEKECLTLGIEFG